MGKPCQKLKKLAKEAKKGSMAFGSTPADSRGRAQKNRKQTMAGLRALAAPKVGRGDTCGDTLQLFVVRFGMDIFNHMYIYIIYIYMYLRRSYEYGCSHFNLFM